MANLSFKQFLDIQERAKPSTIFAALRTALSVPEKNVQDVLDGGLVATPVSGMVATDPQHPKSMINIAMAPATFKMCKSKRCSNMEILNDPIVKQIYLNKTDKKPAQDIYKPKKLSFMLGPVTTDKYMFQGNGNSLLQPGGAAGAGGAPPGGGLGGMLA